MGSDSSMQIKISVHGRTAVSVLAGLVALAGTLAAGEAIQFSSDRTKPVAAAQNPLTKDRLLPQGKVDVTGASPLDGADAGMRNAPRRRLDPKEEKRRENEKLEKENWMILDEGELQAQEAHDEVYGRSDFDSDKRRTSSDIWFAANPSETAKGQGTQRSRNGVLRSPTQNRPPANGSPDDRDASFNFVRRLGGEAQPKSDRGPATGFGAQERLLPNSTDSSLKDLFNSGGFDDRGRGRSELGFGSLGTPSRASSFGSSFGLGGTAIGTPSMNESPLKPAGRYGEGTLGGSFSPGSIPKFSPVAPLQTQPQPDSSPRSMRGTFDLPSRPGFGR